MNRIGSAVVATRRLWKLLSTTQFKGSTEMSTDTKLKHSQKDLKEPGRSVSNRKSVVVKEMTDQNRDGRKHLHSYSYWKRGRHI
jgi:hypothetical protein